MKYIVLRWIRGNMGEIKEYIYEYLREYRRIYDEKKRYDDKWMIDRWLIDVLFYEKSMERIR